jgi:D-glycero-alpha-D-manno-heptose-7-phosphate kinase
MRDATAILSQQDSASKRKDSAVVGSLQEILQIGRETATCIERGSLRRFGELMDQHWQSKKRLARDITNPRIDYLYELGRDNGAIGGKISGAGGGGFLMFYCEEDKTRLRKAMRGAGLRELNFRFEFEGSKVVFDIVSRDGRLAHLFRQQDTEDTVSCLSAGR